jgi:hypothetical protein
MGGGNSKNSSSVYDIPSSILDPAKPDPVIRRFEDYEKGTQINMDYAKDNRYIIIVAIILLLFLLCLLYSPFFKVRKK